MPREIPCSLQNSSIEKAFRPVSATTGATFRPVVHG